MVDQLERGGREMIKIGLGGGEGLRDGLVECVRG